MTTALPFPSPELDPPPPHPSGVTVTARQLGEEANASLQRSERVLAVAIQTVVDYAPAAPTTLLDEAVIRFGAYLLGADSGTVRSESDGPFQTEYQLNHATAFRNSGAAMLLTRHKVRRGGVIG